ncbi:MAG: hypothetical protein M3R14_16570 [Acidobacteriota bacterium]|nr:hypothetical protein [Acidobacteriota bacterium]
MQSINKSDFLRQAIFALFIGVVVFGNFAEAQTKRPKNNGTKPAKPTKQAIKQIRDKVRYDADADLLKAMQEQFKIVESKKDWTQLNRQSPATSKNKIRSAYIAQFEIEAGTNAMIDVIVVHDSSTDKFYEICGFDFPRPFDNLIWINDDTLQFDQWINPQRGGRYQVNLKTGKIVAAGYLQYGEIK